MEQGTPVGKGPGLYAGALGLFDSVVMGVAGSAPAYSIAATTASLVAAVGLAGPAALIFCAIPMFGIAWAFMYLGRSGANAGASYHWVGRTLHPVLGYMSGWSLIVSATIFMVAASLPAGSVTLGLFNPAAADNIRLVTLVGAGWFILMAVMVMVGIRITADAQWIMSTIEVAILSLFAVLAIIHASHGARVPFSWTWFGLGRFKGIGGFASGALVAAFYYWGWDVTANLNEETRQGKRVPGVGGLLGLVVVFCLFVVFTTATNLTLSPGVIGANSGDVLAVLGKAVWPGPGGDLLVLAVLLSTVATLETTLIQVTRTLFAMGRDRVLPGRFGDIHTAWRTPWLASVVVGVVSLGLFVASNFVGSISTVMGDAINSIALQIVVYYALAGLAVAVYYRKILLKSLANFVFIGLWPVVGALFMILCGIYDIPQMTPLANAVGLGALAVGLIPLAVYWAKGAPYFRMRRAQALDPGEAAAEMGPDLAP